MNSRPISSRDSAVQDIRQKVSILSSTLLLIAPSIVLADQGSLTKSTVDQAKKAAMHIQGSSVITFISISVLNHDVVHS